MTSRGCKEGILQRVLEPQNNHFNKQIKKSIFSKMINKNRTLNVRGTTGVTEIITISVDVLFWSLWLQVARHRRQALLFLDVTTLIS